MGNCQAAEAATVVIQHPGGHVERIYWSVSANEVMNSNPGHYVAMLVVASPAAKTENGAPVRQLKLLRPDDSLLIGQVYRLICFEDVLKEFAAKKCVRLGKLLKESGALKERKKKRVVFKPDSDPNLGNGGSSTETEHHEVQRLGSSGSGSGSWRHHGGAGQWKPALQSIAEIGT